TKFVNCSWKINSIDRNVADEVARCNDRDDAFLIRDERADSFTDASFRSPSLSGLIQRRKEINHGWFKLAGLKVRDARTYAPTDRAALGHDGGLTLKLSRIVQRGGAGGKLCLPPGPARGTMSA